MYPCVRPQCARASLWRRLGNLCHGCCSNKQEGGSGMNMHTSQLVLERLGEASYRAAHPCAERLTPWTAEVHPGDACVRRPIRPAPIHSHRRVPRFHTRATPAVI
jgi:hypothetical protein